MQAVMAQPPQPSAYGAIPLRRKPVTNPAVAVRPVSQAYNDNQLGHSRTRTTSSGVFPTPSPTTATMNSQYPTQYQSSLRRTPTSSTSSTNGTPNRSNSGALRRSSSTRSGGNSPTSYVALMRKQKATVWCDRAQYEDPRMLAQQRQAKMRANMEVAGGPHHAPPRTATGGSGMTGGVRSKIGRHHGLPKASLYAPVTYAGSGVPMRLSASEVDEGDDEDTGSMKNGQYHHRTGSGRSSLGSGRRISYANPTGRISSNSTPPQNSSPDGELADLKEEPTPSPAEYDPHAPSDTSYFHHTKTNASTGSGSSGERNFGEVGQMPAPGHLRAPVVTDKKVSKDDLVRRGSVDERTMTMGPRLFVANPDLSD
ncbi:hypothetical protein COCC4DRAFT_20961 [Bipolaris maydis ATCC 48331]|uniref:Uncharacterized protein n=2 Tax=Cochliobolus heterostrophus TaxID=5016 RepID=M2T494_COCH5|nr:uncharacterized protein COCC4DRAFT_20961 [Bipolaris maydis ATCC 48331]EMD92380.1 hypothetical protein COCHEDRAFT_1100155 [Bipolaris maydis C5]KAH7550986.1 hypothetical protein BM1_10359 [Bipolaris maydis]ENI08071.1 hypothetical protein COCC4DRAFT_20961 [Bipolaris maydis ATCC 48331]KAJ5022215.1 hypothetical protein J3E73DRAFT_17594 [Bipolaris maydis]KAJ5060906.1 hypothetical protein J3E74DRAFT_41441 [Bipolaris maydis]